MYTGLHLYIFEYPYIGYKSRYIFEHYGKRQDLLNKQKLNANKYFPLGYRLINSLIWSNMLISQRALLFRPYIKCNCKP